MLLPRVTPLGGMFPVRWAQKGSYLVKTSRKMNPTIPFAPQNESRWRQGMVWTFSRVGSFVTHTRVWPIMHGLMHAQVATRSHGFQLRYAVDDTQLRCPQDRTREPTLHAPRHIITAAHLLLQGFNNAQALFCNGVPCTYTVHAWKGFLSSPRRQQTDLHIYFT